MKIASVNDRGRLKVRRIGLPSLHPAIGTSNLFSEAETGDLIMAVNTSAAYGMYPRDVSLRQVVRTLNRAGFENEQICVMIWPGHHIATAICRANVSNAERQASASIAGLMGWLMKLGAVIIPTVGLFIRSRAFLHRLLLGAESPGLCGNARVLVGLGFSEGDAERFENELREMGALVYVACPEMARTTRAVEILRRTGANETATLENAVAQEVAA
ncbi:MAG TPA: hypothetical protein VEH30_00805 [Terriglobales bacterium]|nr:hypothetical protein [Terriglobales bacterium]